MWLFPTPYIGRHRLLIRNDVLIVFPLFKRLFVFILLHDHSPSGATLASYSLSITPRFTASARVTKRGRPDIKTTPSTTRRPQVMPSSVADGGDTGQSPEVDLEPGGAMHPATHLAIEQPSPQAKSVNSPPLARRFRKHLRTVVVHVRRYYPRFTMMPFDS